MQPSSPDEADILELSPSMRKSQLPRSMSPSKSKSNSPRKSVRTASIEVSDNEKEPVVQYTPDLKKNPIMDLMDEDDAEMTEESISITGESQAEEGEEDSPEASSEGEGETIPSQEDEEESDDIQAIEESDEEDEELESEPKYVFEPLRQPKVVKAIPVKSKGKAQQVIDLSDEEEEEPKSKYVFEPLRQPKAVKAIPVKSKGKSQEVIDLSDEGESFDVEGIASEDEEEVKPLKKPVKPVSKPQSKGAAAKKKAAQSTDEEMEKLTSKIGKTTLDTKGKGTRKSTRAKAG